MIWALGMSWSGPLGVLIANALEGDLSWTGVAATLGVGAILFPLILLSVWGRGLACGVGRDPGREGAGDRQAGAGALR